MTVNNGVVALRIDATPEAMCDWPQTMREKGNTLLRKPMPKKATQTRRSRGRPDPKNRRTTSKMAAERATRATTTVKVGNSFTATPLKKNEPPHRTDKERRSTHST